MMFRTLPARKPESVFVNVTEFRHPNYPSYEATRVTLNGHLWGPEAASNQELQQVLRWLDQTHRGFVAVVISETSESIECVWVPENKPLTPMGCKA